MTVFLDFGGNCQEERDGQRTAVAVSSSFLSSIKRALEGVGGVVVVVVVVVGLGLVFGVGISNHPLESCQ